MRRLDLVGSELGKEGIKYLFNKSSKMPPVAELMKTSGVLTTQRNLAAISVGEIHSPG